MLVFDEFDVEQELSKSNLRKDPRFADYAIYKLSQTHPIPSQQLLGGLAGQNSLWNSFENLDGFQDARELDESFDMDNGADF
jgi:hypothetical protein